MLLPVIRGKIGNWRYYSGIMTFKQVADYVTSSIGELYQAACLDELLQRSLTTNYSAIKDYLLTEDERFFNALILAIYDGDPSWLEIEFEDSTFGNMGFLKFTGDETIFPVDGQHRVAGIKAALQEKNSLENETVPVIFVAHSQTPEGRTRTRKLFSTLNRRAKPVGQNENIALDEDDICSIITRDLLQTFPLFMGENVVNLKGKQIPSTNDTAITSLIALYQCVCIIVKRSLGYGEKKFKDYQLYRPKTDEILMHTSVVHDVLQAFADNTPVINEYLSNLDAKKAAPFRNSQGGNILFRPIAITDYIDAAITISKTKDISYADAFSRLAMVPQDLSCPPWLSLLWDGEKMNYRPSHVLIKNLLIYMSCSDTLKEADCEKLISSYAKALNMHQEEAQELLSKYKDYR